MKRASRPPRALSSVKRTNSQTSKGKTGYIRIISGQWRGRKLPVLNVQGLRPTTDRNKETLFNWLMPHLHNAKCLDVFAGAGGLGLEALSRYASSCHFIELDKPALSQLRTNLTTLNLGSNQHASTHQGDALTSLPTLAEQTFDIIFVDPPYHQELVAPTLSAIHQYQLLAEDGVIYVEHEANLSVQSLQPHWHIIKEKRTSALCYYLLQAK